MNRLIPKQFQKSPLEYFKNTSRTFKFLKGFEEYVCRIDLKHYLNRIDLINYLINYLIKQTSLESIPENI